ncbi:hypothetical protein [Mobilicoccus caccae]|uniref:Uncharacterized protein n=1 Tax=Mobilicoccus caccae TaxID=1859295 RepID=A0ABQ6ILF8_9MICO|nr:hypothetical protein [Mobilicoccus caccae]GMA38768.1 hypothetical protein GCM10025883_08130 [Mobilicoccus caccae]
MRYTDRYVVHAADAISRATSGPVVPVAAAVVQCGIAFGPVSMLVAGDAALMSGATDRAEIASIIEVYAHSPGMAAVREAFPVLDPCSESVGESLLRYALHLLGRPVETQYRPAQGARRCDMRLLGTPLILEFDGMAKFTADRSLTTMGATRAAVSSAVTSVFERDEELGAQGLHVMHVTWHQLLDADGTLRTAALDRRIRTRLAAIAAAPTLEPTARAGSVSS